MEEGEPADEDHDQDDQETEPDGGREEGAELALLRFSRRGREAEEIARLVRTRVLRLEPTAWLTGLEAVRTFAAEHGHGNIPYTAIVHLGDQGGDYPVGQWTAEQRHSWRRHGELADWRTELLAETGFVFDPRDQAFTEFLDVCALYYAEHHTLAAPRAILAGVAFGERLHQARKHGGLGKKPERAQARRERLEAIDPDWNPAWSVSWQRHYAKARWLLAQGATLAELQPGVSLGGDDIGTWLAEQPAAWPNSSASPR